MYTLRVYKCALRASFVLGRICAISTNLFDHMRALSTSVSLHLKHRCAICTSIRNSIFKHEKHSILNALAFLQDADISVL